MKNKQTIIIVGLVILIAVAAVVVALSGKQDDDKTSTSSSSNQSTSSSSDAKAPANETSNPVPADSVIIEDYAYSPTAITVKAGTTVTWTNKDSIRHDVASDDGAMPDGPLLGQGETYKYTFTKAGTYAYHCSPHPYMKGTVVVTN